MRIYKLIFVLVFLVIYDVTFGQTGNGYTTVTTIVNNADLVGDNEIDTGNFTILVFRNSYDIPGVTDEEHERFVFIKVKSIDDLVLNKTYALPDSQIYTKTFYWSPWFYSETKEITGTITRIRKNDTAELFQLNLKCNDKKGETDTLVWSSYFFRYEPNYFEDHKVEYDGVYDNLRIALKEPLKVKKLDLSYQGVWKYQKNVSGKQELPSDIGKFVNLEDLNLMLQNLKKLPPEFRLLTNLRILDISYNDFESFPLEVFSCENLDSLDLKLSHIFEIPEDIKKLKRLKKLVLDDNWLDSFPIAVTNLTELRELSITNGNIKVIPKEIGRLRNLEKLDLGNFWNYSRKNVCDSLINLSQLANLKDLNLEWTKIKSLPAEFSELNNLQVLNIEYNDFTSFPQVIDQIPNLKLLIISHEEFDKRTMKDLRRQNKKYKVQIDYF